MTDSSHHHVMASTTVSDVEVYDPVAGFEALDLYVGNALQAAHYFHTSFGLKVLEYSGIETGCSDATTFLMGEGKVRLLVRSALKEGPIATHTYQHGDSIKDIALRVDDVDQVFNRAILQGARAVMEPTVIEGATAAVRKATIGTPGGIVHSLIERDDTVPYFLPQGRSLRSENPPEGSGLDTIDHVALAVQQGQLETWVEYYKAVFNFEVTHEEKTATEFSAMRSMVVENPRRSVKFPIVEPAEGRKRSQVEDFLKYHSGPGAQHVAILCTDIALTVEALRRKGVEFLDVPDNYYKLLPLRLGKIDEQIEQLQKMRLLIDRDEWGELIQIFSKPITSRPTLFFELVQRKGARGFGGGNIRALFEAVEREQARHAGWE